MSPEMCNHGLPPGICKRCVHFVEVHKCPDCDWHAPLDYADADPLGAWWIWEYSRHRQQAHAWFR